jgi:hypothetical protein
MESALGKLKDAITASEQTSIFGGADPVRSACVEYLRFHGYTVVEPKSFAVKIKTLDNFIEYFYRRLNALNSNGYATSYSLARDRAIAKRFVEARIAATGASRAYVLNECGEIVRTIFDNKEEFINPKYHFDFSIFGNNKMKWMTDKAIHMMNGKLAEESEEQAEEMRRQALKEYSEPSRFDDLEDLLKKMEEDEDA